LNLRRLHEILEETTIQFRKGKFIEKSETDNVEVIEVYAMPHKSKAKKDLVKVDCHFIVIGVDKIKAEKYREELIEILEEYPSPDKLAVGPSYIEVGNAIGSQTAAFQLFALGEVIGLWHVITPETIGITGEIARMMAGSGFVCIDGFKTKKQEVSK
jgi:hypothetical protein